jgi:phosphatidate cytidylyltransferase
MALNIATFKTRSLTATVFVVVMLAGLLWSYQSFFILFSIIHFGCWREYQQLTGLIDKDYAGISPFHKYGVMIAGWCIMLYFTGDTLHFLGIRVSAIGWWLGIIAVFILPINELLFAKQLNLKHIGYSALGIIYISLSWGLMMDLRNEARGHFFIYPIDLGWLLPLVIIASIWINDTMAYISGSLIGKTPFSKISPKKTWEGTAGGAILAVLALTLFWYWEFPGTAWWQVTIIASIATVTGTAGDLLESKLKRAAGVKDSGSLMPGHGGFLDRFDSLLVATPFVWLYVKLLA